MEGNKKVIITIEIDAIPNTNKYTWVHTSNGDSNSISGNLTCNILRNVADEIESGGFVDSQLN